MNLWAGTLHALISGIPSNLLPVSPQLRFDVIHSATVQDRVRRYKTDSQEVNEMQAYRRLISLVTMVVTISLLGVGVAQADIVNGGFETGDFSGWSTNIAELSGVVTSAAALGGGPGDPPVWLPAEGFYFAHLTAGGGEDVYTLLYSPSFWATAGDVLSFNVFFDAGDYLPFDDDGFARLFSSLGTTIDLYDRSVATVGDYGASGWNPVLHTFDTAGKYQIQFGVRNVGDNAVASQLGVDGVVLRSVPEPASLTLLGVGLLGLAGWDWRCRKKI